MRRADRDTARLQATSPVRLEFPILSLHPGLRHRCVAPGVWPRQSVATAAAVIDRIVHHATVLTTAGDSYRLKDATRNQASRAIQEVPRP